MTPSFDLANKVILDIKNGSFNGEMLPFLRYERELLDEASKIARENPNDAIDYLADGITALNSMIFSIREDRYGVEKNMSFQLELIEAALLKIYEHFLNLLKEIES
ncbi:hypothetical protein [Pedobacter nyackensis]|uniref:hypothetical protein n=1 Tax=Pedobacter nyackensis TaxID=475255 RepID=UPI0029319A2F|nr:hypothetical protein [Pedobacter nyackensis]